MLPRLSSLRSANFCRLRDLNYVVNTSTKIQLASAKRPLQRRNLSFSFAGPRSLDEIVKKDLLKEKSANEVADIWYTYHENKENVHGMVLKAEKAKSLLSRAAQSPFFVQPIFRENGYFMLLSQFQDPSHFLLAYLEDYKMDPARAQPLMTFSVFEDYAQELELVLVRADILNKGLSDDEGRKVVQNLLEMYTHDEDYVTVHAFNKRPESFDVDDYVSQQNEKWKSTSPADVEK